MIKVSVVIPVYNIEKYLENCIHSVRNQTLQEIEIICVDDGSTDGSKILLRNYAKEDERIRIIEHSSNLGTMKARKDGVLASKGQYVLFLDGDDELTENACERAYQAIEEANTDILQFNVKVINCGGVAEGRIQSNQKRMAPYLKKVEGENLISACWEQQLFSFNLWNKIFDGELCRKAFEEIEDGFFSMAEDLYAFFLIAYYARSASGIEDCLYHYYFGRGVVGGDLIALDRFDTLLTEKNVLDALEKFAKFSENREFLEKILQGIERKFLADCVEKWKTNLMPEDMSTGFSHMAEVWGFKRILSYLTQRDWYNRHVIAEKMQNIEFFRCAKRTEKPVTIAAYYRSICNGGAQRVVAQLCSLWADLKDPEGNYRYKVILITDELPGETDYALSSRVERVQIPNHTTCIRDRYMERFDAWNDLIDRYQIDLVVSSMWVDPCLLWDMLTVKGHPSKPAFLIHMHNFCCVPFRFNGGAGAELAYDYQLSDGVVTLSECDRTFVSRFSDYTAFIRNPLTFDPFDTMTSSYESNTIVWTGRISHEKRPLDLIQVMSRVVKKIPEAKLYVAGDGDKKISDQMLQLIASSGLEKNVIMEGFTPHIEEYYKKASLFLSTSEYEGFPLVFCEAMSWAIPVVTYEMPWLTVAQDGRGVLSVPQRRYDIMAEKVAELLQNPMKIKNIGIQGKEQMKELASVDIGQKWTEFFEGVFTKHTPVDRTTDDAILFRYLTGYQQIGKDQVIREKNQTNVKFLQACAEKTAIGEKLEQTCAEKEELDAKLQQACTEKSGTEEKLRQADQEKTELGARLEELLTQVKQLSAEKEIISGKVVQLSSENSEMALKLQQCDAEKSEINAKLLRAYEETAALKKRNAALEEETGRLKSAIFYRLKNALKNRLQRLKRRLHI